MIKSRILKAVLCAVALTVVPGVTIAEKMKVALVLPGTTNDKSANQATYEAMLAAQKEHGFEFAYSEKVAQADQNQALADYARRGFGLVVAMGGEFAETMPRAAERHPDAHFLCMYCGPGDGFTSVSFDFRETGIVFGYIGVKAAESNTVGFIGGQKIKITSDITEGMEIGAKMADPDGKVLVTYTNDWNDVAKAKEAALAQYAQGAGAIGSLLDKAVAGIWRAASEKNQWALNPIWDLSSVKPEIALASVIMDGNKALTAIVGDFGAGKLEKRHYNFGFSTPHMYLGKISDKYDSEIGQGVAAIVEDIRAGKVK